MREPTKKNARTAYPRPSDDKLRSALSEEQYYVLCEDGTEHPYSSEYWANEQEGLYVDAATGQPLFTSFDKFPSDCGWPSFAHPLEETSVTQQRDLSHGMIRTEVRSSGGDFHLGHVFNDGPAELGGLRYCINGAALRFVPGADLASEGYDYLLPYFARRRAQAAKQNG